MNHKSEGKYDVMNKIKPEKHSICMLNGHIAMMAMSVMVLCGEVSGQSVRVDAVRTNSIVRLSSNESLKLNCTLMPTSGLIADYNFDIGISNKVCNAGEFYGSKWQVKDCNLYCSGVYRDAFIVKLPKLTYDCFTVALSFFPEGTNKGDWIPIFSFGEQPPGGGSCRWFNSSIRKDGTVEFGFNAHQKTFATGVKIRMREWNYLLCSIDMLTHKVIAVVNDQLVEYALPVDFFWLFDNFRERERCRSIGFSNRNFGLVYKGYIDDFRVYNRAFSKEEITILPLGVKQESSGVVENVRTVIDWANVKIPDNHWLFLPVGEKSVYWNGEISDGNWTLEVRKDEDRLVILPYYTRGAGMLDLSRPVITRDRQNLKITGVGYSRGSWHVSYNPEVSAVVLPETLDHLYPEAFSYCRFPNVSLPKGLQDIDEYAFSYCRELRAFSIPPEVKSIGYRAFQGCKSLCVFEIQGTDVKVHREAFGACGYMAPVGAQMPPLNKPIGPISIRCKNNDAKEEGETVTNNPVNAKRIAKKREGSVLPNDGVRYDGTKTTLIRCPDLESLDIPFGVTRIAEKAFDHCENLKRVSIPTSVVDIGNWAFAHCANLTKIEIPTSVTNIGMHAFRESGLQTVVFPSSVKAVRSWAFTSCKNLESVVLMPGVESIGSQAFDNCSSLSFVRIPKSVHAIGLHDYCGKIVRPSLVFRTAGRGSNGQIEYSDLLIVTDKGDVERVKGLLIEGRRVGGRLSEHIKIVDETEYCRMRR